MRLEVLDHGHSLVTKLLFATIRAATRQPVPDAAKLAFYRRDFYGGFSTKLTHEAMRGHSEWSVADRELMAAYVSKINESRFCVGAHTATSSLAYRDAEKVNAALSDLDSAPLAAPLRETLRLLGKVTQATVTADEMRAALAAGPSKAQIEDALAVCYSFNVTNRLADAFGFTLLEPQGYEAGAKYLLRRGYR